MTVESKTNIKAVGLSGEKEKFTMGDHFHQTKGLSYPDSLFFTEHQAKIFEHLSTFVDLEHKSSLKLLTECCLSISRGDGVFLNDQFVLTPCKEDLIKALEEIYTKNVQKKGVEYAIQQFGVIKKIRKLLKNKKIESLLRRVEADAILDSHSFVETGMMSLLQRVRKNHVVACVDFIWLKSEDRKLWYALQSVGRKVGFVEAYMTKKVWDIEVELGKPLLDAVV